MSKTMLKLIPADPFVDRRELGDVELANEGHGAIVRNLIPEHKNELALFFFASIRTIRDEERGGNGAASIAL